MLSLTVSNLEYLQTCLKNVMYASARRGETVGRIVPALIGAVLWPKDSQPVKVRC